MRRNGSEPSATTPMQSSLRVVLLTRAGKKSGIALARVLHRLGVLDGVIAEPPWMYQQRQFRHHLLTHLRQRGALTGLAQMAAWVRGRFASAVGHARHPLPVDLAAVRQHMVPDLNGIETQALLAAWHPHVLLIANAPILQPPILRLAERVAINYHSGRLPEYGGLASEFWALHDGASTAWVTFHRAVARLDSGTVLAEAPVPILPHDTPRRLHARGLEVAQTLLPDLIRHLERGELPARREPGPAVLRSFPTPSQYLAWRRRDHSTWR